MVGGDARTLLDKVIVAESTCARMRGLLGRPSLPADTGMLIRPCGSIHMWFMRFPIDAAFLDRNLRVLKVSRNLRPWQLGLAPRGTFCVLETAAGSLAPVQAGDRLEME
jgi:uncharacterized membrane protein (UPF0127 family)